MLLSCIFRVLSHFEIDPVSPGLIHRKNTSRKNRGNNYNVEEKLMLHSHEVRFPLRLRGGGSARPDNVQNCRLRGGAPSKSPIGECREIMEQFDKILEEYRKALSPCRQINCSLIPNITENLCKKSCNVKPEMGINTKGCGLPECQYLKYKSALMVTDGDIEQQFIGPAILGTCGYPKCSYQPEPILPPIHWDCPEPLPVGKCKNPNCPYASQEKQPQRIFSSFKGPCGSNRCPYAPPAPCLSPNCPFKNAPACVPLKQKNLSGINSTKNPVKSGDTTCPECPFVNPHQTVNMVFCDNPNCEVLKAVSKGDCGLRDNLCASPNCPYKEFPNPNPNCPTLYGDISMECSNPNCPLELKKENSGSCTNPKCPFVKTSTEIAMQSCSNPNCPFTNSSSSESNASSISTACSNPDCPFRISSSEPKEPPKETCANPVCPFNIPSVESCKNPECPFLKKGSLTESKESCDNPECPYKQGSKISNEDSECECDNPTCPSKKDTCANPNCPFNLRGYAPCANPDCPHKKDALGRDLGFCATPDPSFNEFCADKSCPYHDRNLDETGEEQPKYKAMGVDGRGRPIIIKIGSEEIVEGLIEHTSGDRPSVYDMAPCVIKTCKFMGGHLTCVDCGVGTDGKKRGPCPRTCPGDPICALAAARKNRKPTRRKGPTFKRTCVTIKKKTQHYGEMTYPGYKIGHRGCVMPYFFVPPRMGWLWNIHTPCMNLKPRRGWRPGAITQTVARAIMKHKKAANQSLHEEKKVIKRRKDEVSESELVCPKPTLEIKKREGIYHITMNPLKEPETLQMNENPYMDCTPIQFKVAKSNLLDPNCICTDEGEFYKSDSSSDDELDIEVTTPAGIIHPDRPTKKKEIKVKQTQYCEKDLPPPPEKAKEDEKRKDGQKDSPKTATTKGKEKGGKNKGDKKAKDKTKNSKSAKDKNTKDKTKKEKK